MKNSVGLLLVDDSEGIGAGWDVLRVDTESEFRPTRSADFDLIVSEYSLPTFNGKKASCESQWTSLNSQGRPKRSSSTGLHSMKPLGIVSAAPEVPVKPSTFFCQR